MAKMDKEATGEPIKNGVITIPLSEIKITKGYLRVGARVDDLLESIQRVGLICPLSINEDKELLAGGRRYAAIRRLGWTEVPVHVIQIEREFEDLIWMDENIVDQYKGDLYERAVQRRAELLRMRGASEGSPV